MVMSPMSPPAWMTAPLRAPASVSTPAIDPPDVIVATMSPREVTLPIEPPAMIDPASPLAVASTLPMWPVAMRLNPAA